MRNVKKVLFRTAASVLLAGWMTVIFLFSAQPASESAEVSVGVAYRLLCKADEFFQMELMEDELLSCTQKLDYPIRKLAHMSEYGILALFSFLFFAAFGVAGRRRYLSALALTAAYAATDEFHQLFVPGRAGRPGDVVLDTVGAVVCLLLVRAAVKIAGTFMELGDGSK